MRKRRREREAQRERETFMATDKYGESEKGRESMREGESEGLRKITVLYRKYT